MTAEVTHLRPIPAGYTADRHIARTLPALYRPGMRKTPWFIVTAVVLTIATAGAGVSGFIVAALSLGIPYLISLRLHPRTAHRSCRGTGRHSSPLYSWANRRCQGCGGSGRQVRLGGRVFGTAPVRAEHRAGITARAKMRQNRTWR